MKTIYKDFKVTGDAEVKEISREEWLELFRDSMTDKNDTTFFGYAGTDGILVIWQGKTEMRFRVETLSGLASFLTSVVDEPTKTENP